MQQDEGILVHFGCSMLAGLFLCVLAAPIFVSPVGYAAWLRVEWIPLLLFFWAPRRPNLCPLWVPWVCGLLLDVLRGDPLGLNALCFLALFAILSAREAWFRSLSMLEQCIALFLLLLIYTSVTLVVLLMVGRGLAYWWLAILPVTITSLLWPVASVVLERVHARAVNV